MLLLPWMISLSRSFLQGPLHQVNVCMHLQSIAVHYKHDEGHQTMSADYESYKEQYFVITPSQK